MENNQTSYEEKVKDRRLGKAPAKSSPKLLQLRNFADTGAVAPGKFMFWKKRRQFPICSFGNTEVSDCTRASQALATMRMERLETRRTLTTITNEEVIRVYFEMTTRLYGGGDVGAYEMDALDCWRREEQTFRDQKGHPYTIDAYTRINQADLNEVKNAIYLSGAHGIKVCFNLPKAWQGIHDCVWDLPEGQVPTGEYLPGSWGGHSMFANQYDEEWLYLPSSWEVPDGKISWRAFAVYCDEAYLIVDSIDTWRKTKPKELLDKFDLTELRKKVNEVSSIQIAV